MNNDPLDDFLREAFAALPAPEPSEALRERLRQRTQVRAARYVTVIEERRGSEYRLVRREEPQLLTEPKEAEIAPCRPVTTTRFYYRKEQR